MVQALSNACPLHQFFSMSEKQFYFYVLQTLKVES